MDDLMDGEERKPYARRMREQAGSIDAIEDKVDLALEILEKISMGMVEGSELAADDIEDWKQRCRARAAARRGRRRKA
jgi:hypothetical protein